MTATATAPRVSKLKAVDPSEAEPSKPKMIVFGPSGVGKTWFAIDFPKVYYISPEKGATLKHYRDRLKAHGGKYFGPEHGALDFEEVIGQLKALATEKHEYKTVVIDSITELYLSAIARQAELLGADKSVFGAEKKPAIQNMRRLMNAVARLDMNVIFVAHEQSEWGIDANGNRAEIGKIPECWPKMIYQLDLTLQFSKAGKSRYAAVRKTRLLGFPEGERFPVEYSTFAERYGKDIIEKEATVINLASPDQVEEIKRLVDLMKVDEATIEKWLDKANAENFHDFTTDQASKIIKSLTEKLTTK